MKLNLIVLAGFSLIMFMIGLDKFFNFLEPCSLLEEVPDTLWKVIGALQLVSAVLILSPKFRKTIAGLFFGLMIYFIYKHLSIGTFDIGGAIFMAIICLIIFFDRTDLKDA